MSLLSELLVARATELNLSRTDIANLVDMTPPNVSQLFNGLIAKPRKWREIAGVLHIDEKKMIELMQIAAAESLDASRAARKKRSGAEGDILASLSQIIHSPLPTPPTVPSPPAPIFTGVEEPPLTGAEVATTVPVLGQAVAGEDGRYVFDGTVLETIFCPTLLKDVRGAYASYVDGVHMFPRYKVGEILWFNPNRPARLGDDVMVQLRPRRMDKPNSGYLRQFIGWDADEIVLSQYNGGTKTTFQRASVLSVDVVVFAAKL